MIQKLEIHFYYFIEKGANINLKNNEGNAPLHLALKSKKKIIKILMDNKAALDILNEEGDIALYCCRLLIFISYH